MASSSYLSLIALLVFAQLASLAEAQETIEVSGWIVPYEGPTEYTANVGDTIIFQWDGFHNVYIHPSMTCDLDNRIKVGSDPGSEYTFVDADGSPGGTDMFFSCDIGDGAHCRFGQALTVKVFSSGEAVGDEAPDEVTAVSEAPVSAPDEAEPEPAAADDAATEAEPEPAAADDAATETESSPSSSGNSRVNSVATAIGLLVACLALVL